MPASRNPSGIKTAPSLSAIRAAGGGNRLNCRPQSAAPIKTRPRNVPCVCASLNNSRRSSSCKYAGVLKPNKPSSNKPKTIHKAMLSQPCTSVCVHETVRGSGPGSIGSRGRSATAPPVFTVSTLLEPFVRGKFYSPTSRSTSRRCVFSPPASNMACCRTSEGQRFMFSRHCRNKLSRCTAGAR